MATSELITIHDTRRPPPNITWKHLWPLSETRDASSESPFLDISIEVMTQIFQFLSVRDLGNVSSVCRSFKMIADQDGIWKSKFNSKYTLFCTCLILA